MKLRSGRKLTTKPRPKIQKDGRVRSGSRNPGTLEKRKWRKFRKNPNVVEKGGTYMPVDIPTPSNQPYDPQKAYLRPNKRMRTKKLTWGMTSYNN